MLDVLLLRVRTWICAKSLDQQTFAMFGFPEVGTHGLAINRAACSILMSSSQRLCFACDWPEEPPSHVELCDCSCEPVARMDSGLRLMIPWRRDVIEDKEFGAVFPLTPMPIS